MESLRDIGYELPAAVADLVDNSLDAEATRVEITVAFEGADSWIRIADDGTGMSAGELNESMRYGTERDYAEPDLGKFGLGLKTASLSQCRRLTVATRTNSHRREIEIRRWDLDHVADEDAWELLRLSTAEVRAELIEPLQDRVGTVVMWERLDRVLDYKLPTGLAAEHGLMAICREIEEHLAMVFHRFLSGEARRSIPFVITMNGNLVDAWDPFARAEPSTIRMDRQTLPLRHAGRTHNVVVQPYILPNQEQFSTQRAWDAAGGPKKWNRQQGFYVYRGGRMIQSGGWNRLRTPDEHTKLARIAVDIPRAADTAFELNVSKMRVIIPAEIRAELRTIASGVASRAQFVYRKGGEGARRTTAGAGGRALAEMAVADAAGGASPGSAAPWLPGIPAEATPASASVGAEGGRDGRVGGGTASAASVVDWRVVCDVLHRELSGHPQLLQRVLDVLGAVVGISTAEGESAEPPART